MEKSFENLEDGFVCLSISDAGLQLPLAGGNVTAAPVHNATKDNDALKSHPSGSPVFEKLSKHSNASRVDTGWVVAEAVRAAHPGSAVVPCRDWQLNIFGFPEARVTKLPKTELREYIGYMPPPRRDLKGALVIDILYGCFVVEWSGFKFIMHVTKFTENVYETVRQHIFVHENESAIHQLIAALGAFSNDLHEEIPVYAHGYWEKDHQLWLDVQKANWEDVILDASFKKRLQDDITGFFKSEQVYKDLAIPWKRGMIFLGPPGNGKTISLKAIMKENKHPSLYVKNFTSFMGDEYAMQMVFDYARRMAPCIVVLEDLDSLINDGNRSFFLNEIDGLQGNNGLLIIGTTNHFDKLDPALSKRPSRFDRKFNFAAPTREERILYGKYWQNKLKDNKNVEFPDSLLESIADLTDGFSFAYIKEAMISSLVILATSSEQTFEEVLKEQIASLRKAIEDGSGDE